jgi:hypothetical protein
VNLEPLRQALATPAVPAGAGALGIVTAAGVTASTAHAVPGTLAGVAVAAVVVTLYAVAAPPPPPATEATALRCLLGIHAATTRVRQRVAGRDDPDAVAELTDSMAKVFDAALRLAALAVEAAPDRRTEPALDHALNGLGQAVAAVEHVATSLEDEPPTPAKTLVAFLPGVLALLDQTEATVRAGLAPDGTVT